MVIGIDLDGVVFDTEEFFRTYAHLYSLKTLNSGLFNREGISVFDRLEWSQENADEFFDKYTALILNEAPFKAGAVYVLKELQKMGHKLVCVTLRGFYRECEIEITERRLKEAGLVFDSIYYKQADKSVICKQENVDIMIEDNFNNIKKLIADNINCFYFRGAGIKDLSKYNVTEVQNWAEIYEKIVKN